MTSTLTLFALGLGCGWNADARCESFPDGVTALPARGGGLRRDARPFVAPCLLAFAPHGVGPRSR